MMKWDETMGIFYPNILFSNTFLYPKQRNVGKLRTQISVNENRQLERRGDMSRLYVRHEIKCCPIMSPVINVFTDVSLLIYGQTI